MARMIPIVHYLNQFFGQIGGEDKAHLPPRLVEGAVGPGRLLQEQVRDWGQVVATVICGDSYIADHLAAAAAAVTELIAPIKPGLVIAGPAFAAGRYGLACGEVCRQVADRLGVATVSGMYPGQPAVAIYHREVLIVATGESPAGMAQALGRMADLGRKLVTGVPLGLPAGEGYVPQGIRRNVRTAQPAAERAVVMALQRARGEAFVTEVEMPRFEEVAPAPSLRRLDQVAIALITTGGIIPRDNPDRLESFKAEHYGKYPLQGLAHLSGEEYRVHHGGYYPGYGDADPDRLVPVDACRDLEQEGAIGHIFPYYYTVAGTGTYPQSAERMAREIADDLKAGGAGAAIITST